MNLPVLNLREEPRYPTIERRVEWPQSQLSLYKRVYPDVGVVDLSCHDYSSGSSWTPGTFPWEYHLWSVLLPLKINLTISCIASRSLSVFLHPSYGNIPWWKGHPFFQPTIYPPRGDFNVAPSYDSECRGTFTVCLPMQFVSWFSIFPLISSVLWRDLLQEIRKIPLTLWRIIRLFLNLSTSRRHRCMPSKLFLGTLCLWDISTNQCFTRIFNSYIQPGLGLEVLCHL